MKPTIHHVPQRLPKPRPLVIGIKAALYGMDNPEVRWMIERNMWLDLEQHVGGGAK